MILQLYAIKLIKVIAYGFYSLSFMILFNNINSYQYELIFQILIKLTKVSFIKS